MRQAAYFDTPERAERVQLILHLLANTPDMLYLRAPNGAGKTRFAQHMAGHAEPEYQVFWVIGGTGQALAEQLPGELADLSEDESDLSLPVEAGSDKPALLVVDNADALAAGDLVVLYSLRRSGTRILLLGTGHLASAEGVPPPQFVDLPAFTAAQTLAFIQAQGKLGPEGVDERMAMSLHRAAAGIPGSLLDALAAIPVAAAEAPERQSLIPWRWLIGGAGLAVLLLAALLFQDRINGWFQPPATGAGVAGNAPRVEPQSSVASPPEGPPSANAALTGPEPSDTSVGTVGETTVTEPDTNALPEAEIASPAKAMTEADASESVAGAEGASDEPHADPVLDAVIEEAISAAGQARREQPKPEAEAGPPVVEPPTDRIAAKAVGGQGAAASEVQQPLAPTGDEVRGSAETGEGPAGATPKPSEHKLGAPQPEPDRPAAAKSGTPWLLAQPAGYYTLQLVGGRQRSSIDKFIHRYGIAPPYAVFARDLDGKPWYSLVSGSYPNRESAVAARAKLPKDIDGVWPRTFASIHEQLDGG
jgi:DamX protein